MHKLISLIILLTIFLSGCKTSTEPVPPEQKPPGYQEDVPWPSLADSPWPTYHGDFRNTGRSSLSGPTQGIVDWEASNFFIESGAVVGPDSTIYFCSEYPAKLNAFSPQGNLKWDLSFQTSQIITSPVISADTTIYLCTQFPGNLYAISKDGLLKWKYETGNQIAVANIGIDLQNNLYVIDTKQILHVVSSSGKLLWKLQSPLFRTGGYPLTFSPDGQKLYILCANPAIISVNTATHQIENTFDNYQSGHKLLLDAQGNLYLFADSYKDEIDAPSLFSIKPDGALRWYFQHGSRDINIESGDPTMDKNGNVYFGWDTLYSVDYSGKLKWKLKIDGVNYSPILSDDNNNVYVTVSNGGVMLLALKSNGEIQFNAVIDNSEQAGFSGAIGFNNSLYLPTFKTTKLFSIK